MGEEPQTYRMALPDKGGPRSCPVDGYQGRAAMRTAIWFHFLHRHVLDTVAILEEGNFPYPQCPRCNILVPCRALNGMHISTAKCARGAEQKKRRLVEVKLREIMERAFQSYEEPLENVTAFRYLGIVMTANDDDWSEVVGNI